ncbi:MAG: M23 family metallopeptidase [Deltaproteobacteria bacterium]|nr:MAG: M23 family metallopeptidase [Deltaproteobacteria bacterium]
MRPVRLLLSILLLSATPVSAFDLELAPHRVRAGAVFLVRLSEPGLRSGQARFGNQSLPLFVKGGSGRVLVPVPLTSRPGTQPLRLSYRDGHNRLHHVMTGVAITAGDYPVERLTLPERMVSPQKPEVVRRIQKERLLLARLFSRRTSDLFWEGMVPPVDDPPGSRFGRRRILNGKPRAPHGGVDFRSPRGRPVRSPAPGTVVLADELFFTGRTLVIDHGGGLVSVLAHLEKMDVAAGGRVGLGQVVGTVGATGRATGPHLHWTVRLAGEKVDPLAVLALLGRSVP